MIVVFFFFYKQKTAYEMRMSDWSSDVCSSDLLLTDDGGLQARIADPRFKLPKTYLVQVEGDVAEAGLASLRRGVRLKDGPTRPAEAERLDICSHWPALWPRDPPVRFRKTVPYRWRSEARRVGNECVRTCKIRWAPE